MFRLADESYGLDCPTQEGFITRDGEIVSAKRIISLHPHRTQEAAQSSVLQRGDEQGGRADDTVSYQRERDDGWMEVELGQFCWINWAIDPF